MHLPWSNVVNLAWFLQGLKTVHQVGSLQIALLNGLHRAFQCLHHDEDLLLELWHVRHHCRRHSHVMWALGISSWYPRWMRSRVIITLQIFDDSSNVLLFNILLLLQEVLSQHFLNKGGHIDVSIMVCRGWWGIGKTGPEDSVGLDHYATMHLCPHSFAPGVNPLLGL